MSVDPNDIRMSTADERSRWQSVLKWLRAIGIVPEVAAGDADKFVKVDGSGTGLSLSGKLASDGGTIPETDNANTFTEAQSAPQFTLTGGPSGTPAAHALYQDNVPKAWAQFDGTGTAALQDSFNVSGFADNGTGHYTLTWDRDFANANYAAVVTNNDIGVASVAQSHAAGTMDVKCFVSNTSGTLNDEVPVSVVAFGDQ